MANQALDSNIIFGTDLFGYDTTYSVQAVNLPGVALGYSEVPSRYNVLNGKTAGRKLEYNPLSITLLCDENMTIWSGIVRDILSMKNIDSISDGWIILQDSTGKTIQKITYKNILPVSVGDIEYTSTGENNELTFDMELVYDYYTIEEVTSLNDDENVALQVEVPTEVQEPDTVE